jgi:hypothetical protein
VNQPSQTGLTATEIITIVSTILTAIVALYGAILSTYTFIVQRRDAKPAVKTKLTNGFLDLGHDLSNPMFLIEAANDGNHVVTLSSVGMILPDKRQLILTRPRSNIQLPYELKPGTNCTVWIEIVEVAHRLREQGFRGKVKLVGFYLAQTGVKYKSKPYKLDIDSWLKRA